MIFDVVRVREGGWILPRFRSCMHRPVRGSLSVEDRQDPVLNRSTRTARILDPRTGNPVEGLPPLHDATLVCVRSDYLSITGFERIRDPLADREYEYAQTWVLTLPADG